MHIAPVGKQLQASLRPPAHSAGGPSVQGVSCSCTSDAQGCSGCHKTTRRMRTFRQAWPPFAVHSNWDHFSRNDGSKRICTTAQHVPGTCNGLYTPFQPASIPWWHQASPAGHSFIHCCLHQQVSPCLRKATMWPPNEKGKARKEVKSLRCSSRSQNTVSCKSRQSVHRSTPTHSSADTKMSSSSTCTRHFDGCWKHFNTASASSPSA